MGGSVINGGSYRGDFHASVIPFPIQTDWLRSTYTIQFALFWVSETDKRKKGGVFNPFLTIPNCSRDRPQLGKIGPGPALSNCLIQRSSWRISLVSTELLGRVFLQTVRTCPNSSHHQQILQSVFKIPKSGH